MNKTVALVKAWGAFEENHPDGELEDFCRHYLAQRQPLQDEAPQKPLVGGVVPPLTDGTLLRIIGRIQKLNFSYANMALKGTDLNQIEEFGILLTIKQEKNPRKTEVIYANLFELSSGTDMLGRMIKRGLIKEYDDQEDKRSKRLELTTKGEKSIVTSFPRVKKMAEMMLNDLNEDDKQLCIQLLKKIEIKFSALWPKHRGRPFEEVYEEVVNDRQ
ncbi:MarR family winged helix-turn-helix transcriptional regulator [Chitinophaga barathri]|uniref:MarR family transcriptional regulator n=1 Tax=Chitinophaga barathri TaxID=1647451 RepID=A0A3N4MJN9_9BACT|nr:MarR family winged helix-turn-helix transcriptional regulator [Chitinophaga barathri]RPD42286.1 MarR family transcriptional regulator [Chitinophaga barathri]